jgi:hypothetical protein
MKYKSLPVTDETNNFYRKYRKILVAFKVIKWFEAIEAFEERLTGSGSELANHPGIGGAALWAFDVGFFSEDCRLADRADGGGDAVGFEFLFTNFGEPVSCPGWGENGGDFYLVVAFLLESGFDIDFDHIHGWAAGVGWSDDDFYMFSLDVYVPDDSQVFYGEDGDFRVWDLLEDLEDFCFCCH